MSSSIVKLQSVKKKYLLGEELVEALAGVSLEIKKGEFAAIIGPSGSGKSTLMHIIGLLDTPTEGKVFLDDRDISTLNENERAGLRNKHIGFVFQSFNLLPKTTAVDNVELPLIYSGIGQRERIRLAKEALISVGLKDRLGHFPSQLSGGQQQRVAIARALVNKPDIIMADEPTGNLDSKSGREIMDLLKSLSREGKTVILVTHDMDVAKNARRIIKIIDGKIVSDGVSSRA
ncbi:macrolide ABC transporter ATP-binding protein [Candidatus Woesebacteria bacterium RIFOXYA1_FULL_43_9]|uniref:Macrolide ABC transporter ATP-binding protein n=1 Tax=Candidatus Woesebacteria bacterium RIFOXYA1_FULL_43_9 TaxID=1802534 RepID=A0A1F8CKN0_9BACT|nr:MAG: macrolide ABC transporter ATP-binding protein [Candidatus Woesebacteria bacterium RIFOXYA1_FULL_43_9]